MVAGDGADIALDVVAAAGDEFVAVAAVRFQFVGE